MDGNNRKNFSCCDGEGFVAGNIDGAVIRKDLYSNVVVLCTLITQIEPVLRCLRKASDLRLQILENITNYNEILASLAEVETLSDSDKKPLADNTDTGLVGVIDVKPMADNIDIEVTGGPLANKTELNSVIDVKPLADKEEELKEKETVFNSSLECIKTVVKELNDDWVFLEKEGEINCCFCDKPFDENKMLDLCKHIIDCDMAYLYVN